LRTLGELGLLRGWGGSENALNLVRGKKKKQVRLRRSSLLTISRGPGGNSKPFGKKIILKFFIEGCEIERISGRSMLMPGENRGEDNALHKGGGRKVGRKIYDLV